MAKKMLIDATHAEETRVVVVDGNKVEEFDFESVNKRQLAGNIYLAKVTRVEPSLQAAFVDYGGNRHGFLAFSEIHPDYYQIPVADREALIAEERAYAKSLEDDADEKPAPKKRRSRRKKPEVQDEAPTETEALEGNETAVDATEASAVVDVAEEVDRTGGTETSAEEPLAEEAETPAGETAEVSEAEADPVQASAEDEKEPAGETTSSDVEAPDADVSGDNVKPQAMSIEGEDPVVSKSLEEDAEPIESGPSLEVETEIKDEASEAEAEAEAEAEQVEVSAEVSSDEHDDGAPETVDVEATAVEDVEQVAGLAPPENEDESDDEISDVEKDDEVDEDIRPARKPRPRRYKIQEVIKVRQILLVQVVKEERGNKGAALTTYLSLAGRYCVLMPNTARGGGISRKITNASDRKKLKEIANSIEVPDGAGLIVRTAGAQRTKAEIKRDYEYLQRLWEQIRDLTLKSVAPAQIYEEGNLIKRSIRDLYNKEIDEVMVEGEEGYRTAKDFMKMLMPSHAKNVKLHQDGQPLFAKYQVESYLAGMFNPTVQLKSGGYIVIGITEALVAIDVNSGRATKEGSIEDTALKTNLEAAEEVARQLRLRDLAGLIVIDFIDMDERKNNTAVEKRFKDRLKSDRARIQVGRISGFGLLEMSRQRLRPGMLEATTQPCPACHGTGLIRSDDSIGLMIIRQLEEEGTRRRSREVLLKAPVAVINFLVNTKREHIADIESRFGMSIRLEADPHLVAPDFSIEKFKTATRVVKEVPRSVISIDTEAPEEAEDAEDIEAQVEETATDETDAKPKRKRRRRRRRKTGDSENGEAAAVTAAETDVATDTEATETTDVEAEASSADATDEEEKPKRKRRSRRGGRGRRKSADAAEPDATSHSAADADASNSSLEETSDTNGKDAATAQVEQPIEVTTADADRGSKPQSDVKSNGSADKANSAPSAPKPKKPKEAELVAEVSAVAEPDQPPKPKRRGWWSRG